MKLFSFFHLNMMYSSIEEQQRSLVIERCYWPLLNLAEEYKLPLGIEASGLTLEIIQGISPAWIAKLRELWGQNLVEFVGSGYSQLIGPLVPAEVNAANLRLGHQVYAQLLGMRPHMALVNEQAYSGSLVAHYLEAGYRAILMDWNNPARYHPEWDPEYRYLPQYACGPQGEEIALVWNNSIAFQKFQRYTHREMELKDYLRDLERHLQGSPRSLSLYGNDAEIIDFRPGRYHTEAALDKESEWQRVRHLVENLIADHRFQFVNPSQVLELLAAPKGGNRIYLESPEAPIPVKKQGKYNITRWAVTGRDDLGINTSCWRIYKALEENHQTGDDYWKELCYLWSSDFRTHITETRWQAYIKRLNKFARQVRAKTTPEIEPAFLPLTSSQLPPLPPGLSVAMRGHNLQVETPRVKVFLNCRRGLAIDALWFKELGEHPLCGTLPHGYYDNITMGADYYTGHMVFELPGQPKVTDLNPLDPQITWLEEKQMLVICGRVDTPLGPVDKMIRLPQAAAALELNYRLAWPDWPIGSLRLGAITLNPRAFDLKTLFYRTHNGGRFPETFYLFGKQVEHGQAASFLVSALQGVGITQGLIDLGDASHGLRIIVDRQEAALLGLVTYRTVGPDFFCRLVLTAQEMDETSVRHPSPIGAKTRFASRITIMPI